MRKCEVIFARALRERGVRVRILTNSLASTDVAIVHAGYAKYRKDLLRAGIEPYSGFWRRFGVSFMSLMPIESQL